MGPGKHPDHEGPDAADPLYYEVFLEMGNHMVKNVILLAAYRGESYLPELLDSLDGSLVAHIIHKQDVIRYILRYGSTGFAQWINDRLLSVRPDPRSGFGE